MKKSEIYKQAQIAVLQSTALGAFAKLEILRELMHTEDVALFVEKQEGKKAE